jgi:hypothetical protein
MHCLDKFILFHIDIRDILGLLTTFISLTFDSRQSRVGGLRLSTKVAVDFEKLKKIQKS